MSSVTTFFEKQEEPNRSVFLFLKEFILNSHESIELLYKWKLPYFYFKGKPLCYLWKNKKTNEPYVSFAKGSLLEHPALIKENRKVFKILPINPNQDIDTHLLQEVLEMAIKLY